MISRHFTTFEKSFCLWRRLSNANPTGISKNILHPPQISDPNQSQHSSLYPSEFKVHTVIFRLSMLGRMSEWVATNVMWDKNHLVPKNFASNNVLFLLQLRSMWYIRIGQRMNINSLELKIISTCFDKARTHGWCLQFYLTTFFPFEYLRMVASVEHDIVNETDSTAHCWQFARAKLLVWNVDVKIYDIMDGI